jgi:hypothetical protein
MTDHLRDDQLDHDIRRFLAWRAEDIAEAPTATEVAMGIRARSAARRVVLGIPSQLAWLLIAALLALGLIGAAVVGANLLRDGRALVVVDPTPTAAPIAGSLPAEQKAVIARHVAALNSRVAEAFVGVFADDGAFNPRGDFAASSSQFGRTLPIADRALVEPFMAINEAWGFAGEVLTCDQLARTEYADLYRVYSEGDVYGHCAVKSQWPTLSLEMDEWWSFEFRGAIILWWGQTVRDADPLDRTLPLGLAGLLEWEAWLESTDPDAAARLLNPRVYPVTVPCRSGRVFTDEAHATTAPPEPPCEFSADDVDVERITSNDYGSGESDWVIAGKRFHPSALIPYDVALADEIQASIEEFLVR